MSSTGTEVLARLRAYRPTHPLPRDFYTSEAYFRLELDTVWYRDWLFVGHDCEITRPGEFFTLQVGDYPLVVVRDRDGEIRAFHNACRHRGSRLCAQERGTLRRFVCPYHQWTYQLDGRLLAARDMIEGFERKRHGLRSAHCARVGGYLFVCLAERAPDFQSFARQAEPYLLPHRLEDAKVAFESTIVEHANWKLVWENNRECYHCAANHPELCRTFPATPTVMAANLADNTRLTETWARWERAGLPSRFDLAAGGQTRLARMPLLDPGVSFTLDGMPAVNRPLSPSIPLANVGSLLMFHYPSTWGHVLGDHATTFRVLPLGPTETQLTTKWLVHKDAQEGIDYSVERLIEVWSATNNEDQRVCQENQWGVNSPSYEPGPYSPVHEAGVMQFVEWYQSHLTRRLTAPRSV